MKPQHYFLLFLFLCQSGGLVAQTTIFDALAKQEPGKGKVTISQLPAVRALVGVRPAGEKTEVVGDKTYLTVQGYRIQIFTGNNQRKSKDEAFTKKGQIDKLYNDIPTYVTYTAPFWRLHAGDYMSYEEAFCIMHKLIASFPSFKKEISVIKEDVRIALD
ncbi:MAG: SPOR domain-containing protein [Tannerella sp.]|jgi:hypothetical protein|nr:SPOR domain-containing protein [Tannerella sp.]